jgi:hypothetical protein
MRALPQIAAVFYSLGGKLSKLGPEALRIMSVVHDLAGQKNGVLEAILQNSAYLLDTFIEWSNSTVARSLDPHTAKTDQAAVDAALRKFGQPVA